MICHYTHLVSEIRSYKTIDGYENKEEYQAIVNVVWLSDIKVMLRGANGKICRRTLIACFSVLWSLGAELIVLTRAAGKRMPFGKIIEKGRYEDTWEIDLSALKTRNFI